MGTLLTQVPVRRLPIRHLSRHLWPCLYLAPRILCWYQARLVPCFLSMRALRIRALPYPRDLLSSSFPGPWHTLFLPLWKLSLSCSPPLRELPHRFADVLWVWVRATCPRFPCQ